MCGIVGYIGMQSAVGVLLEGLRKLEYRGYDSAGIAVIEEGAIHCIRARGKLHNLQEKLEGLESHGRMGIGHTRWATHGKPEERNAHPHLDATDRVAVVQNGIIENYQELRDDLMAAGVAFRSETDTEVVPNLIARQLARLQAEGCAGPLGGSLLLEAVNRAIAQLRGAFALAIVAPEFPNELIVVRQQAPISIGFGQGEFFCASDTPAIVPHTPAVLSLDNGELARLTPMGVEIYGFGGDRRVKFPHILNWSSTLVEKQGYRHYMLKEICEQPAVVRACLEAYTGDGGWIDGADEVPGDRAHRPLPFSLAVPPSLYHNTEQIQILACGTSWHAGLVGRYLLEQIAGIPTTVHYASEFRYAPPPPTAHTLTIGVTQSGETTDTLAALEMERDRRKPLDSSRQAHLIGITNRPENTIARVVDYTIPTHSGIEVGVAATKTFVTQLLAFYALALNFAQARQTLGDEAIDRLVAGLQGLPSQIERILETQGDRIEALAHEFSDTRDFVFIGRGINFPIALEGALKLKEISYIHAEGYPSGELKHGPIALLEEKVPVVAIAMPGSVFDKTLSNAQEAKARDSRIIGVTTESQVAATASTFDTVLVVPDVEELLSPVLSVIPLQLLSYHIAARRGLDVDQPRNLAKSVTVE